MNITTVTLYKFYLFKKNIKNINCIKLIKNNVSKETLILNIPTNLKVTAKLQNKNSANFYKPIYY